MLEQLDTALNATGYPFKIYGWSSAAGQETWGTYTPENAGDLLANNRHVEGATYFFIDLYTRDSSAVPRRKVEAALSSLCCAWRLTNTQYESDTGMIHFSWRCGFRGAF